MSDYFFYDLNKKMADLANKQQLAEDAHATPAKPAPNRLMEAAADYSAKKAAAGKDIGKPGKNFSKIAAGAAKRYGSAEAGKRVAGAVLNKLRHPTESIDQAQLKPWKATMKEGMCSACGCKSCKCDSMDESALQAAFGKKKYGDQGMKALQQAGRNHAGAATMNKIRNRYDKYDESMTDEGNAFSGAVVRAKRDGIQPGEKISVGGKQYKLREEGDAESLLAKYSPDMHNRIKNATDDQLYSMAQGFGGDQHSRVDHELNMLHKVRHHLSGPEGAGARRVKGVQDRFANVMSRKLKEEGDAASLLAKYSPDMHDRIKNATDDQLYSMAQGFGGDQHSRVDHELDQLHKARHHLSGPEGAGARRVKGVQDRFDKVMHRKTPRPDYGTNLYGRKIHEADATPQDVASRKNEIKAVNAPAAKASAAGAPKPNPNVPGSMIKVGPDTGPVKKTQPPKVPGYNDSVPVPDPSKPVKEAGRSMTAKQQKFAKLAPPVDKITFADKIVGAKKAAGGRSRDMDEASDWSKLHEPFKAGNFDDTPTRRRSSSGGEIDTSEPGVTRHRPVKGNYSGAAHDAGADDEPSGAVGRRKVGAGQGTKIGAKINRGTSKLMTREGDMPEDMIEPQDSGEYDREGEMAKDSIKTVVRHAQALEKILGDNDNLPEWVQSKLAKIENMMTAVDDYMQNQQSGDMPMDEESTNKRDNRAERAGRRVAKDIEYDEKKKDGIHGRRRGSEDDKAERAGRRVTKDIEYDEKHKKNESSDQHFDKGYYDSIDTAKKDNSKSIVKARKQSFEEESTNTRDNRAERAGRKVAKDIEYDEKKKDGIHGQRRGSEDSRAERAGKRVTKDIEYDEKKKKKKEVDETKTSGSVATGAAPKRGGGHNYGKGIYDSLNRQLENMISESMNINMSMNNDEHGGPRRSLTVTATDEDASQLALLLKMAGMGVSTADGDYTALMPHSGEEVCSGCGMADCGCGDMEQMDESHDHAHVCPACGEDPCCCDSEEMDEDRWGAEQPPKLPYDMTVTAPGGVDVNKSGSDWVYKSNEPGGRITATIPAKSANKMFPMLNMDEAYGDTDASENSPDYPTDEVGTADEGMYSGGLNGPNPTGQTTTPVNAAQKDRLGYNGLREDEENSANGRDVEKILTAIKKLLLPNPNDPLGREKKPEGQTNTSPPANDKKDDSGEMSKLLKMLSKE